MAQSAMTATVAIGVWVAYRQLEAWRNEAKTRKKADVAESTLVAANIVPEFDLVRASHGQRPDLPHGEGAMHPPRGPGDALCWTVRI